MKKLFPFFLTLFYICWFSMTASADVVWGPVVYVAMALQLWPVILLVAAVIVVTILFIRHLKKK